eukprot:TRINITY_DN3898_c0_g4_i1.p1 TRINITY_DN3898_c0_g4~~TRINITY_DN3898_c0_g4_i1.p1  ORF type:complete len:424 (+),score=125.78 TRINITY_DN3898_c0_g4_i1:53-1324(+)
MGCCGSKNDATHKNRPGNRPVPGGALTNERSYTTAASSERGIGRSEVSDVPNPERRETTSEAEPGDVMSRKTTLTDSAWISSLSQANSQGDIALQRPSIDDIVLPPKLRVLNPRRYKLLKEIGRGQYGVVFKAQDRSMSRIVAIKKVNSANLERMGQDKLAKEVALMSKMNHNNVIRFHQLELDRSSYRIWMVMEYIDGEDLKKFMKKHPSGMPEDLAKNIFLQIIKGLNYIHSKGVVHRDLKPENIMINTEGVVKVADFGLSCFQEFDDDGEIVVLTTRCGTPNYVAPDVVFPKGGGYNGFKSDMWSLGVVLYVMLTATLPFSGPNLQAVLRAVKDGTFAIPSIIGPLPADILKRLIEPDANRRATLPVIAAHPWLNGECVLSPPLSPLLSPGLEDPLVASSLKEWSLSLSNDKATSNVVIL